jgi:hypothetical protein
LALFYEGIRSSPKTVAETEKIRAPEEWRDAAHLSPRLLQGWDDQVQTGPCIVRQVQQQVMPEFIHPDWGSSTPALTPAALEVHMVRLLH